MIDLGSIAYTYIWMGFVKLMMWLYSLGGLQFAIGVFVGFLIILFKDFFKTIALWLLLALVIGSLVTGIVAAKIDWKDIRDGNWKTKVENVTPQQYNQAVDQLQNISIPNWTQVGQDQLDNLTDQLPNWTDVVN